MSIAVRLEKLRFILEEIELAQYLAKNASDDASARLLSRHVIIRAENFIAHARAIRKPLKLAGYQVSEFHSAKEVYANNFESYFGQTRHKLGAHIQDFDFAKRIKLWNEIKNSKIDYFANDAHNIYEKLRILSIPEFIPYSAPEEFDNSNFDIKLNSIVNTQSPRSGSEIATDPLALSRPNTSTVLNGTPIHIRAGQLNLLRRWIDYQQSLLVQLNEFKGVQIILKARIISDIVNFCDCLVTRKISSGGAQEMDGLDRLLLASGESCHLITQFLQIYEFEAHLAHIRDIRNKVGAHIEIDHTVPLSELLNKLENFPLSKAILFFKKVENLFVKVCHDTFFLKMHLSDGQFISGVLSNNPSVEPYGLNHTPKAIHKHIERRYDCDEVYEQYYQKWKNSDQDIKEEGRYYFWNAFMHAFVSEEVQQKEILSRGGVRSSLLKKRTSHCFILKKLLSAPDAEILEYIFPLILACANGEPRVLTEVVLDFSTSISRSSLTPNICFVIGELASWNKENARSYLERTIHFNYNYWTTLIAKMALFKMFIRTEGLARINHRTIFEMSETAIGWLTDKLTDEQKLIMSIVFISQFYTPSFEIYIKPFEVELAKLNTQIKRLIKILYKIEIFNNLESTLNKLINTHDYVGISLILFDMKKETSLGKHLLSLVCSGVIVTANHDQAKRHLVGCYLRNDNINEALQLIKMLIDRNPDIVDYQIILAEIFASMPEYNIDAKELIDEIKENYSGLSSEEDLRIAQVEDILLIEDR